jgi:peptidoglycan/xylan/chitin deacetylase (PgdA/CDA1 family)
LGIATQGKKWTKKCLVSTRVLECANRLRQGSVAILVYHSVMDDPQRHATTLGEIIHSTDQFRSQMEAVARYYNPVTLDDVLRFVENKSEIPSRAVVVTFDDGYADNAEVAAPILQRLGILATFYVTVHCIDTATPPWVARVRYAFLTTGTPSWSGLNGKELPLTADFQRQQAFTAAAEHCATLTGEDLERFVSKLEHDLEVGPLPDGNRLMMSWEQARQLVKQGHIVGSHTVSHPNMAHVTIEQAKSEFVHSKRRMEQELSADVVHFAYPCPILTPHWSQETLEACREAGYKTAVTTNSGCVRGADNPLCLRRVPPSAEAFELRWNLESTFMGRSV